MAQLLEWRRHRVGKAADIGLQQRVEALQTYVWRRHLASAVQHLLEDAGALARTETRLSVCFVDIVGYTTQSRSLDGAELVAWVDRFEQDTTTLVVDHGGQVIKTIGDEVMIVSRNAATLTEWAVGFLGLFPDRPQPRVGIHFGKAVYREGDYFGGDVNLTHRVVTRAIAGEVMATEPVAEAIADSEHLEAKPIGEVVLRGFPRATPLYVVRSAH